MQHTQSCRFAVLQRRAKGSLVKLFNYSTYLFTISSENMEDVTINRVSQRELNNKDDKNMIQIKNCLLSTGTDILEKKIQMYV